MKKQRLSCITTSVVFALAFPPFYLSHALECILYIYSHPHSIYYIAHIRYLALSFVAPSPTWGTQHLFSLPDLMPADEG